MSSGKSTRRIISNTELEQSDLIVDAIYKGGNAGNAGDDPIHKLLGCGTQGGFRYIGSIRNLSCKLVVLYSSLSDPDWPDYLDEQTGQFTYFGDNKRPGHLLHDTPRKGNIILRESFEAVHRCERGGIPPFFVFTKGPSGRDVIFKGLTVPGALGLGPTEDLVAIWKTKNAQRFQNYKAIFTILDVPVVQRAWIDDLKKGDSLSVSCPDPWRQWVKEGVYKQLRAERTVEHRSRAEQLPGTKDEKRIIEKIYSYFRNDPHGFERCAAELIRLMDRNVVSLDVTRPWIDGGRDAVGKYRIGLEENSIGVEFALEAKCYNLGNAVGIRETSRLISRLKYRQFGILVTTSYVHTQAYREIIEDRHPVILVCARDIVKILARAGYNTDDAVQDWIESNFPKILKG